MDKKKQEFMGEIEQKARLLSIASDPTRLLIFCYLFHQKEACVSDIADSIKMSVAVISHHLQLMRDNGLCESQRDGQRVCYRLSKHSFNRYLQRYLCTP